MPESGYQPVNKYLPPRPRKDQPGDTGATDRLEAAEKVDSGQSFFRWLDQTLSR